MSSEENRISVVRELFSNDENVSQDKNVTFLHNANPLSLLSKGCSTC